MKVASRGLLARVFAVVECGAPDDRKSAAPKPARRNENGDMPRVTWVIFGTCVTEVHPEVTKLSA